MLADRSQSVSTVQYILKMCTVQMMQSFTFSKMSTVRNLWQLTSWQMHLLIFYFLLLRLPGLESSSGNREEEDSLYDEMMISLLKIVTMPLALHYDPSAREEVISPIVEDSLSTEKVENSTQCLGQGQCHGFWNQVQGPVKSVTFGSDKLWQNLINWRLFTRKNRSKIVVMWSAIKWSDFRE